MKPPTLTQAISALGCALMDATKERKQEFEWFKSHAQFATKHDLKQTEGIILMKLSEIKTQIAASAARSKEAFAELSGKIAAMQTQIDELIAGAGDVDVTDEQFLEDLRALKADIDQLADIVPATPEP